MIRDRDNDIFEAVVNSGKSLLAVAHSMEICRGTVRAAVHRVAQSRNREAYNTMLENGTLAVQTIRSLGHLFQSTQSLASKEAEGESMTDNTNNLKALAEACPQGDPLRLVDHHGKWYLRNTAGMVFDVHRNPRFSQFMVQNEAYAKFFEAATPAVILDLIGQAATLAILREMGCDTCGGQGHVHRADGEYLGTCDNCNAYELSCVKHERDQLKEEVRRLTEQVKVLQSDANSWQSGYNEGREIGTKTAYSERAQLRAEVDRLLEENSALKFVVPDAPPRPPEGEGLPRFGIRWNGPQSPITVPMPDGYWTPWHLAADLADYKHYLVGLRETHGYETWSAVLVEVDKLRASLDALVSSESGAQVLGKLDSGQGVDTEDGKAWLAARDLVSAAASKEVGQ